MSITKMECSTLQNACNSHGITISKQIIAAEKLHEAASDLVATIRAEVEPDIYALTLKTLDSTFAALLSWPSNPARLAVAVRLERTAAQFIVDAFNAYAGELMESFRKPFDDAAIRFTAGDKSALPVLNELGRVRDALALALPVTVRNRQFDELSRCLFIPSVKTLIERMPVRTDVLRRHEGQWWALALAIPGVRLVWNSPEDQKNLNDTLPNLTANEVEAARRSF